MEQAAAQDPLIGAQVGNYEVKRKLGEGGMGAVYLAEHPLIGKKVALKVLHQEFASNQDVVSRFFNEAKAVNDIQHPNIVDIIDYGVIPKTADSSAVVYFIMEFLGGRSLAQLIRDEAPLAPERALRICLQIADALGASHRASIVHRDLKPDNVILVKRGHEPDFCKVLDFGIAKLTGDQKGSRRTRTGIVMGTPAYMSPEQCEGRGAVDHRTDVYALGILLYECLTGRVPFQGEGYGEILVQHLTQPPAPPSSVHGVPPHVEQVCLKMLEKKPDNRYPNMAELMNALADPVTYVETHGGLHGFLHQNLGPASPEAEAPFSPLAHSASTYPVQSITPASMYPPTPPPGHYATPYPTPTPAPGSYVATPAPGTLAPPTPTPMAMSYAPHEAGAGGSKLKWVAVAGALAVIGVIAVFVAMGSGEPDPAPTTAAAVGDKGTTGEPAETGDGPAAKDPAKKASPEELVAAEKAGAGEGKGKGEGEGKAGAEVKAAAEPEKVMLTFESTPDSASVFLGDSKKSLGTTPFSEQVLRQTDKVKIRFVKEGYEDKVQERTLDTNASVSVELKPIKKRERDRGTGDRRKASPTDGQKGAKKSGGEDGFELLREGASKKKAN